jgi:hypothetical protein
MPNNKKKIFLMIESENDNHAEKAYHELKKYTDEAHRFGVEIDVRRVQIAKSDVEGFEE